MEWIISEHYFDIWLCGRANDFWIESSDSLRQTSVLAWCVSRDTCLLEKCIDRTRDLTYSRFLFSRLRSTAIVTAAIFFSFCICLLRYPQSKLRFFSHRYTQRVYGEANFCIMVRPDFVVVAPGSSSWVCVEKGTISIIDQWWISGGGEIWRQNVHNCEEYMSVLSTWRKAFGAMCLDLFYKGADKSLARPGRKQATATEGFDFHISYL